mmetsp:Transcript_32199/g.57751  ORF Transcript_32199/g.57751 Transcript_32199/m.57751 type:complete len:206 (+) Transcript_32199:930-1547(+)
MRNVRHVFRPKVRVQEPSIPTVPGRQHQHLRLHVRKHLRVGPQHHHPRVKHVAAVPGYHDMLHAWKFRGEQAVHVLQDQHIGIHKQKDLEVRQPPHVQLGVCIGIAGGAPRVWTGDRWHLTYRAPHGPEQGLRFGGNLVGDHAHDFAGDGLGVEDGLDRHHGPQDVRVVRHHRDPGGGAGQGLPLQLPGPRLDHIRVVRVGGRDP